VFLYLPRNYLLLPTFRSCVKLSRNMLQQIWHLEDRVSWYILITKAAKCTISQIYLIKYSTCFGQVHCPSSGVLQNCIHAMGICHVSSVDVCSADANRTSRTINYCVYTVLKYSWWWTVDLSETCRVLYQINLRNSAFRWLLL
jgi:hypothetical protein